MNRLLEMLNYIVHGILGYCYLYTLTDQWRFPKSVVKAFFIAGGILYSVFSMVSVFILGMSQEAKGGLSAAALIVGIIIFFYLFQYRDGRACFICFCSISFSLTGVSIGEIIGSTVTISRLKVKFFVYAAVFLFIYRYFRKPLNRLMQEMDKGWGIMALVPFSFSVMSIVLLLSEKVYENMAYKIITAVLVFTSVCCYMSFYKTFSLLQEQYKMQANYALLQTQIDAFQKQMEITQQAERQYRIYRHDIRHYSALMQSCLEDGDILNAKKLLASMEITLEDVFENTAAYSDSPFINTAIAGYAKKAEEAGIRFSAKICMPQTVTVEYTELAIVISNALENAWKACMKMPVNQHREIILVGREEGRQFLLEIANTYSNKVTFNKDHTYLLSETEGHGYGTQSIRAFAEKYHAFLEFKPDNGWFRVRLLMS